MSQKFCEAIGLTQMVLSELKKLPNCAVFKDALWNICVPCICLALGAFIMLCFCFHDLEVGDYSKIIPKNIIRSISLRASSVL